LVPLSNPVTSSDDYVAVSIAPGLMACQPYAISLNSKINSVRLRSGMCLSNPSVKLLAAGLVVVMAKR
jgi:hypothetical protein